MLSRGSQPAWRIELRPICRRVDESTLATCLAIDGGHDKPACEAQGKREREGEPRRRLAFCRRSDIKQLRADEDARDHDHAAEHALCQASNPTISQARIHITDY